MSQRNSKLIIPDAEFIGRFPVRSEIEILPEDKSSERKIGWVVSEIIGMSVVNPRAVQRLTVQIRRTYDEWANEMISTPNEADVRRMIVREAISHDFDGLRPVLENLYPEYLPIYEAARIMK